MSLSFVLQVISVHSGGQVAMVDFHGDLGHPPGRSQKNGQAKQSVLIEAMVPARLGRIIFPGGPVA